MTELKTREPLLRALREAASWTSSPDEVRNQRVSFIMGSVKSASNLTRDRVEEVLARQEGRQG